ncbi:MAG: DUF4062 domain-containing protein [Caldilineaceae bacterium]
MIQKRLQVFISSTYTDLIEERQSAVEAILSAGHIPAGMELFAAGDESQMEIIKRWIQESDVYLLILGGRYGSIELKSGISYIELEYDFARYLKKPFFSLVIRDDAEFRRAKKNPNFREAEHPKLLKQFREKVMSHMVAFWEERKDIELAIHKTLADFTRRDGLVGWVRGDEGGKAVALAEEVARLAKENDELRRKASETWFAGVTFYDLQALLQSHSVDVPMDSHWREIARTLFDESLVSVLTVIWYDRRKLSSGVNAQLLDGVQEQAYEIGRQRDLIEIVKFVDFEGEIQETKGSIHRDFFGFRLTSEGKRFINRLRTEYQKTRPQLHKLERDLRDKFGVRYGFTQTPQSIDNLRELHDDLHG